MGASQRQKRLKWLCRRGMKELDVLFERFIVAHDRALGENAWPELEELLRHEDDTLWDWLQNPDSPGAEPYQKLLTRIRYGPGNAH